MQQLQTLIAEPWMQTALGIAVLALVAWLGDAVVKRALIRVLTRISARTAWRWDDVLVEQGVFRWLAQLVPAWVIHVGIGLVPGIPASIDELVRNLALVAMIVVVLLAINAALNALAVLHADSAAGRMRSIKGYVQLVKLMLFAAGGIVGIAILMGRSPLLLLSGLGAISAVLLLVFKDTILSVVASVQLASNDMLRVGDWIEMPQLHADGDVIDIALHTVKVRNWDKTITTIPTWRLISESYKNWRGMQETGGRRIKRALYVDADSVHFLGPAQTAKLARFRLLHDYLAAKQEELEAWNAALGEPGALALNQRRLTNLGTFRAYALAFLQAHPGIHKTLTCMVRQLAPGPTGIPLELYAFTASVAWADYEGVQGDLFDHLIAIAPEFGLRLYQQPSGADLRAGVTAAQTVNRVLHEA